jgi:hypothetical protein
VNDLEKKMNAFVDSKSTSHEEAVEIFQGAIHSVLENLEKDAFVRFVRLESWKKYVKKNFNSKTEIDKIAIHRSQLKQVQVTREDE